MTLLSRVPLCVALLCATPLAWAEATLVPDDPAPLERVHLRQTVDGCMFDEERVYVRQEGDTIVVVQPPLQCFAPGPEEVVDIALGAYPVGEYHVEIRHADDGEPIERLTFRVDPLPQIAIYPPPPRPLHDATGIYMADGEDGWGLTLHQGRAYALFGAMFVFGPDQQPEWYTLQDGQWTSPTRWEGTLLHSTGPAWSIAWNPADVKHTVAGEATLDFSMTPARVGRATLSYTLDGATVTKTISRVRF